MSELEYTYDLLIPDATGRRLLIAPRADGWALPSVRARGPGGDSWWRETERLNAAVASALGLRTTTLDCWDARDAGPEGGRAGVFVLEPAAPGAVVPEGLRWADAATLAATPAAQAEQARLARRCLAEVAGAPALGAPWTRPGWLADATAWISAHLGPQGAPLDGPVDQMRSWFLSAILRASAGGRQYVFKATPSMYAYEPTLVAALAAEYPGFVPATLAVDAGRGWLLMEALPGVRLDEAPDPARYLPRWEAVLRRLAHAQVDYVDRTPRLRAWGLPDWSLDRLAEQMEPLVASLPVLLRDDAPGLTIAEMDALWTLVPRLKTLCARLAGYGIPATLNHGDFHSPNLLAGDSRVAVVDWGGFTSIAHPFFCLATVFEEHPTPAARARLLDAYLPAWRAYGSPERLRAAVALAQPLATFYNALGHLRQLCHALAPWDAIQEQGNLIYYLRALTRDPALAGAAD
jgi:hypothetical protein